MGADWLLHPGEGSQSSSLVACLDVSVPGSCLVLCSSCDSLILVPLSCFLAGVSLEVLAFLFTPFIGTVSTADWAGPRPLLSLFLGDSNAVLAFPFFSKLHVALVVLPQLSINQIIPVIIKLMTACSLILIEPRSLCDVQCHWVLMFTILQIWKYLTN